MTTSDLSPGSTVLAIETSCDETCAAVVQGRRVLTNVVASQTDLHVKFGGVVPEIASRRHLELVDAVIAQALEQHDGAIDAIAVTRGPGLIGALLVGLAAAKSRAYAWNKPLIAVDHLLGHVASALIADDQLEPPFLCLLVSGGHTMLLDVQPGLQVRLLGTTRDDAAGEAFDKGARLLGLGLPGGALIEQLAKDGDAGRAPITPAMVHHDSLDTSFAGIKTALAVAVRERSLREGTGTNASDAAQSAATDADLAASLQHAIVETLAACVAKALRGDLFQGPRRGQLAVVGGVAANTQLRARLRQICRENDVQLVTVPLSYCGDNAAMIGVAAQYCAAVSDAERLTLDAYASSPLFRTGSLMPKDLVYGG